MTAPHASRLSARPSKPASFLLRGWVLAATAACLWVAPPAHAEGGEAGRSVSSLPLSLPLYQQECAACHIAFPARGLPAASWQRLMSQLPHHFGTDASLDPAATQQLSAWLQAHAASGRRAQEAPKDDRLTTSAWFVREHHEISAATWKKPAVGKASNCAACHRGAAQGDFSEDVVRIPR